MFRPGRRPPAPLCVLLVTWALSVFAPALHSQFGIDEGGEAHSGSGRGQKCSGIFVHHFGVAMRAACDAGDDCRDPTHHHHAAYQHDATHCPACASSLERASELPSFRFSTPRRAFVVVVAPARVATPAERHVFALARAPPSQDGCIVRACGIG